MASNRWRGHVQGNPDLLESLRTEGISHLAEMKFLHRYCKFFKISLQGEDPQHYMDNSAVKGHQDVKKSARELKWEDKLNVTADLLATKARYEITMDAWYEIDLRKHCKAKFGWKNIDFNLVDWETSRGLFWDSDFYHKQFITWYTFNWLPVRGAEYSRSQ
eukprot:5811712-Ditylum_brightwellii.AAC.1